MTYDYFYGQQSELFTFYRVPKVLFTNERFWNISADAKMLYGILLDRMSLSAKNGWIDENGRVYIIFTIDEAKSALNCAEQKAIKLLSELEKKAGLIERKRQGLGKPKDYFENTFVKKFDGITTIGLLLTLVMIFSFQGNIILENPLHIVLIAVPLILQTFLIFAIAYIASYVLKLPHKIAAPAGMIGASNFFELAVAVAIALFGTTSPAALATTVGVLTEVPVMLFLVKIANKTANRFLKGKTE